MSGQWTMDVSGQQWTLVESGRGRKGTLVDSSEGLFLGERGEAEC